MTIVIIVRQFTRHNGIPIVINYNATSMFAPDWNVFHMIKCEMHRARVFPFTRDDFPYLFTRMSLTRIALISMLEKKVQLT